MSRLREEQRAPSQRVETWELRAKFAAALSRMYAAEVPAYTTLVEVSAGVNRDMRSAHRAPIGWARCSG